MMKRFTTITIVSNDNRKTRFITFDTKHLDNFKKYVITFLSVVTLLSISGIIILILLISSGAEISKLNDNIQVLKSDLKLVDSLEIRKKVINIDENINGINKYLLERGVMKTQNAGGPYESSPPDARIYDLYLQKTSIIATLIHNVPIGLPHEGDFKSFFGNRSNPFSGKGSEFHKGLDIKGNIGDTVRCTADGTVILAEYDGGYGKCIRINHHNGITTIFGHLSEWNVKKDAQVKAGDIIGFVGSTGRSTGPHLHYEIRYNDESVNPQNFLNINN